MTKQHIFGKRLLSLLPKKETTYLFSHRTPTGDQVKRTPGHLWGKSMRRVCRVCNNGWMRDLEERTFPLLKGLIVGDNNLITADRHADLAARLSHMIMVASLARAEIDPVSDDERATFKANQLPPDHWEIWLCRADNPFEIGQFYYSDTFRTLLQTAEGTQETRGHATTFILGRLCVFVIGRKPSNLTQIRGLTMARIWPETGIGTDLGLTSSLPPNYVQRLAELTRRKLFPETFQN